MLHLMPLSFSFQCRCSPPSRRFVDGGSPSQRAGGAGLVGNGVQRGSTSIRRRALRGTDVQLDTSSSSSSPSSRQGGDAQHDEATGQGEDDGWALLVE